MRTLETILLAGSLMGCPPDQGFSTPTDVAVVDTGDTGEIGIVDSAPPEDTAPPCPYVDSFTQPEQNPIDVVFVIDTSPSINDDIDTLTDNFTAMYTLFPPQGDWLLGMTTTNVETATMATSEALGPTSTASDLLALYDSFPKDDPSLQIPEQGFASFESYIDAATWTRDDAELLVIFFSDEDDQSYAGMTDSDAVAYFEPRLAGLRDAVSVASIVNFPEGVSCNAYDWMTGTRYIELTQDLGGTLLDICFEDWTSSVADVSTSAVDVYTRFHLTYTALSDTIIVREDGELLERDGNWFYTQPNNTVYFSPSAIPKGGTFVEIGYDIDTDHVPCPY